METTSEISSIDNYFGNSGGNQSSPGERMYPNSTISYHHPINSALLGLLLGTVSLLTVFMNVLVLYAVKKERTLHTVGNLYIVSLSAADLVIGATVMPLNLVYLLEDEWKLGHIVCQFWLVMDYVASTASIFSLFILCLDRYRSVRQPLRYLKYRTRGRASLMISGAWLLSMTWIVPILGWRVFSDSDPKPETENKCDTDFRFVTWFKVLTAILNFYVPSVLMLWFYTQIYMVVRQHYRQKELTDEPKSPLYKKQSAQNGQMLGRNHMLNTMQNEHSTLPVYSNVEDLLDQYSLEQPYFSKDIIEGQKDETWAEMTKSRYNCRAALFTVPKCLKKSVKGTTRCPPSSQEQDPGPEEPFKHPSHPLEIVQSEKDNVQKIFASVSDCNLSVPNSVAGVCEIARVSDVQQYAAVLCESDYQHPVDSPWPMGTVPKFDSASALNLKQSWQKLCAQSRQCIQSLRVHKERKAAKQLGFIIAGFMLCWIPYFVTFMVMAFCKTCVHHDLHMFTIWLGYFNSTLNPFIYPLCNENFKRIFKRILHLH